MMDEVLRGKPVTMTVNHVLRSPPARARTVRLEEVGR